MFYLSDQQSPNAGGETAFPKGNTVSTNRTGQAGTGFKVHPGKGNAVLFYSLLEDGNGDELSLHAALPVAIGEKWLGNLT